MMRGEALCPSCRVERADYEGPARQWLPRCPNCGSALNPHIEVVAPADVTFAHKIEVAKQAREAGRRQRGHPR